jgi:glycosyltransferase involved in cell wall biosynthesis
VTAPAVTLPAVTEAGNGGRPRVCLMAGRLGLGGAEKQVVLLARGLHERGVPTTVLTMVDGGEREAELTAAGVPVVHLGFRTRAAGRWRWPANLAAFVRTVRCLRRIDPDVLHAFLPTALLAAAPAGRLAGTPALVAGRRGLGDHDRRGPLRRMAGRLVGRMADLVVANAQAVADDARVRDRIPPDRLVVVPNGLPDQAFAPADPAELDTGAPVVLCVANFWPYKGHRHLLDAIARLRDDGLSCTLALAGSRAEGDPSCRDVIERQARRLRIDVRFLGQRTDVRRLLARADVFALPSLTEGMSNAVMEAMAAGRPVVATDVGGTRELLGDCGVLVPPGDPGALAAALGAVLGDPALAARLGAAARARCRARFHVDAMVDRHVRIYQALCATHAPSAEH